jgi:hypothetical protein
MGVANLEKKSMRLDERKVREAAKQANSRSWRWLKLTHSLYASGMEVLRWVEKWLMRSEKVKQK